MLERRFEDRHWRLSGQQVARPIDRRLDIRNGLNHDPVRYLLAGSFANGMSERKAPERILFEMPFPAPMNLQPKPLWAVLEGCDFRFAEPQLSVVRTFGTDGCIN